MLLKKDNPSCSPLPVPHYTVLHDKNNASWYNSEEDETEQTFINKVLILKNIYRKLEKVLNSLEAASQKNLNSKFSNTKQNVGSLLFPFQRQSRNVAYIYFNNGKYRSKPISSDTLLYA